MYANGEGVAQDLVQAHMWLSLATSAGLEPEEERDRDARTTKMTPEQVAEAERLASEWEPKSWEELQ